VTKKFIKNKTDFVSLGKIAWATPFLPFGQLLSALTVKVAQSWCDLVLPSCCKLLIRQVQVKWPRSKLSAGYIWVFWSRQGDFERPGRKIRWSG